MVYSPVLRSCVLILLYGVIFIVFAIALPSTSEAQISPDSHSYQVPQDLEAVAGKETLRDHVEEKVRIEPVGVELVRILDVGLFLVGTGAETIAIHHFDREWKHRQTFGTYGEGPGDFLTVWDLFVQGEMLYGVDNAQRRITGFEGFGAPYQMEPQVTFSFPDEMNVIHSVETAGEGQVLFSGRGATFFEDIIEGRNELCAVFLARRAEGFEGERCVVEYPSHIIAAEEGSVVARDNRVMMRRGASGNVYVWFTHAPDIVRIDPDNLSTEMIEIESPFYAAPEHVHYTELASQEELRRWQSGHYTVAHVAETDSHLVVQYEGRGAEHMESYVRVVIIDRETEAAVAMLRLDGPFLRLYNAVGRHELLLVQFEENHTTLATVDVRNLTADLSE